MLKYNLKRLVLLTFHLQLHHRFQFQILLQKPSLVQQHLKNLHLILLTHKIIFFNLKKTSNKNLRQITNINFLSKLIKMIFKKIKRIGQIKMIHQNLKIKVKNLEPQKLLKRKNTKIPNFPHFNQIAAKIVLK